MKKTWILLAFMLFAMRLHADALPYDENADAKTAVAGALAQARSAGKPALIVFGANWCIDCRELDSDIYASNGRLGEDRYVIVKVDVGNFDRNIDLAKAYGNPIRNGIPGAAIVTPESLVLFSGPLIHLVHPYRHWMKPALKLIALTTLLLGVVVVLVRGRRVKRYPGLPG